MPPEAKKRKGTNKPEEAGLRARLRQRLAPYMDYTPQGQSDRELKQSIRNMERQRSDPNYDGGLEESYKNLLDELAKR